MAAAKKRAKTYAAVVAVAGAGTVTKKQAKTHLSDFIEAVDGEILWVLPIGADVTKSLTMVFDFLWAEEARYVLVTDEDGADQDWVDNAESVVEAEDTVTAALEVVAENDAEDKRVIFLLDEEHEGDLDLLESAMDAGLKCLDLGAGLAELEVEDGDEEDEPEEEDTGDEPDEDEESEEVVEVELPPKVQKLLDKGDAEGAALQLAEEFSSSEVRELADEVGVTYKKGAWAKTIAKDIIDAMISGEAPEEEAEEPEEAPEPAPEKKIRKRTPKAEAAPEPPVEDQSEGEMLDASGVGTPVTGELAVVNPQYEADRYRVELIGAAAHVAGQKGATEAKKFLQALSEFGLL